MQRSRLIASAVGSADRLADPRVFAVAVCGYYALAWSARMTLLSGSSGDEAQLMLYSQHLSLGYDLVNPPVAGWLGWLVERAVGPGLGGALLVRYGLLAAFFIVFHGAARALVPDRRLALAAAIAPVGFWFLGWEALRSYMDSLALIVALAAVLALMPRLARAPASPAALALLAGVSAFGLLAKYSFLPAFLVLAAAAALTPSLAPAVRDRRFWGAAGAGLLMAAPAYLWAWLERGAWLQAARYRLVDSAWASGETTSFAERLLVVPDAAGGFLLPMLPLMLLVFVREIVDRRRLAAAAPETARWLCLYLGALLLCATVLAAALGLERLREHYMFVLIPLPIAIAAWLPGRWVRAGSVAVFVWLNAGLAGAALIALAGQAVSEPLDCSKCRLTMPWGAYAAELRRAGFERGTIVAFDDPAMDAGPNLRRFLPEARVWSAKRPYVRPPPSEEPGACLLVWNDSRHPRTVDRLRAGPVPLIGGPLPAAARIGRLRAPLRGSVWFGDGRPAPALGYALLAEGVGDCR